MAMVGKSQRLESHVEVIISHLRFALFQPPLAASTTNRECHRLQRDLCIQATSTFAALKGLGWDVWAEIDLSSYPRDRLCDASLAELAIVL